MATHLIEETEKDFYAIGLTYRKQRYLIPLGILVQFAAMRERFSVGYPAEEDDSGIPEMRLSVLERQMYRNMKKEQEMGFDIADPICREFDSHPTAYGGVLAACKLYRQ